MAALRIYRERYGECPWLVLTGRLRGERREAMSLAIAAGVEDRVMDLAFVEPADLPALYSAAELMVFPSLFEGFGIPLVEAMACGCPIAAADATTIPEITNGAALLFDPLDSDQMAEAIHRALNDADLETSPGCAGICSIAQVRLGHDCAATHRGLRACRTPAELNRDRTVTWFLDILPRRGCEK